MDKSQGKVITTLQERRRIERELEFLLHAHSRFELAIMAGRVASFGPQVIPVLLNKLNTTDNRLLTVLGAVAAHLDRAVIVPALREAALDPERTDRARMGALVILSRFLGEEVDETYYASLRNPQAVALEALQAVLEAAQTNRTVLLDYARTLLEQPLDVILAVIEALRTHPSTPVVELLRLLAQDVEPEIAEQALRILGMIKHPAAVRALQILLNMLPEPLRSATEHSLRKLRFSGLKLDPLPPPDYQWRALVSPPSAEGTQMVWIIGPTPIAGIWKLLGLTLDDGVGIREAFGEERVVASQVPTWAPRGYLHHVTLPGGAGSLLLLETDFEYGRQLVKEALMRSWASRTGTPLSFRLLSDYLWGYAWPAEEPEPVLPSLPETADQILLGQTRQLLQVPAFAHYWLLKNELVYRYADRMRAWHIPSRGAPEINHWTLRLSRRYFTEEVRTAYKNRLLKMSEWLMRSRQREAARLALVAARTITTVPPESHPLVTGMVGWSLDVALRNLQAGLDPRAQALAG